MSHFFRVYTNFTEYIPIDETEVEKAMHAYIEGLPVVFEMGATSRIDRIVPDLHRAAGINPEWKLNADDWNELERKGLQKKYMGIVGRVKNKVHALKASGREDLIGKNIPLKELPTLIEAPHEN